MKLDEEVTPLHTPMKPLSDAVSTSAGVELASSASVHVYLNEPPSHAIKGLAADMTYEERLAGTDK